MPLRPRSSIVSWYVANTLGFTIACVPLAVTWAMLFDLETEWFQARLGDTGPGWYGPSLGCSSGW